MATIDFTRPMWGHALHGFTFREAVADSLMDRLIDWWRERRRYTVSVHSCQNIKAGDYIRYSTKSGPVEALVASVHWCGDPQDMARIEILVTGATP